jgi:hypothetical protein
LELLKFSKGISSYMSQVIEFLTFLTHRPFQERTMSKICTPAFAVLAMVTLCMNLAQAQSPAPGTSSAPSTAAKVPAHPGKSPAAAAHGKLDLHTPPLNQVMPSSQLRYIMANDDADADSATEVSVKGTKTVIVPGAPGNQLQAIPWAIFHPTEAWRIFTPLEQP